MSKRSDILTAVETVITGTGLFAYVYKGMASAIDLTKIPFPAIFIYGGPDTRRMDEEVTIGKEVWDWTVVLEIWAKDLDFEAALATIHSAMFTNRRFGGLARTSYRLGSDPFIVDPSKYINGLSVPYMVKYEHTQGIM